jgi:sugar/nucleoside kinase (ribokinase family)
VKADGVICVGRLYCDLNFSGFPHMPDLGCEVFADDLTLHGGGGAFITASYLAALGCPSRVMGVIPRQPFASIIQQEAQENGVALVYCSE